MAGLTGVRLRSCAPAAIEREVLSLVARSRAPATPSLAARLRRADDLPVVVVPDTHYPFHPSTGQVTNPAVVAAVCRALEPVADAVTVFVGGSAHADAGSVAEWLGYRRLAADTGFELLTPADCERVERPVAVGDRQERVSLPAPLVEAAVVNVPTLRRADDGGMAGGLANLGRLADHDGPTADRAVAATRAVAPARTLLDGTWVYAGRPHRARFLLAGEDPGAVDRVGATLLGVEETPALRRCEAVPDQPAVDGLSVPALAAELPAGEGDSGGSDLLERGYRLYARLSGDCSPPQVIAGGEQ